MPVRTVSKLGDAAHRMSCRLKQCRVQAHPPAHTRAQQPPPGAAAAGRAQSGHRPKQPISARQPPGARGFAASPGSASAGGAAAAPRCLAGTLCVLPADVRADGAACALFLGDGAAPVLAAAGSGASSAAFSHARVRPACAHSSVQTAAALESSLSHDSGARCTAKSPGVQATVVVCSARDMPCLHAQMARVQTWSPELHRTECEHTAAGTKCASDNAWAMGAAGRVPARTPAVCAGPRVHPRSNSQAGHRTLPSLACHASLPEGVRGE